MEIIEFGGLDGEGDSVDRAFVVNLDGQIASVVVSPEFGWLDFSLSIGPGLLLCGLPLLFSFISCNGVTAGALTTENEFIDGTGSLGRFMVDLLHSGCLLFWQIILGEISESGMRIFGRVGVFPRFIVNIFRLEKHSFQSVFNDNS